MDDGTADKAGFRGPFLALHDHILSFLFMHGGSSEILSSQEDEQIVLDPSSHIAAAFLIMQVFSMKNQTMRRELEVSKGQMEQSVNGLIDVMQKFRQKRHPERPSNSSSRSPLLPSAPISLPSRVSSKGMDTMLCIHQCLAMQLRMGFRTKLGYVWGVPVHLPQNAKEPWCMVLFCGVLAKLFQKIVDAIYRQSKINRMKKRKLELKNQTREKKVYVRVTVVHQMLERLANRSRDSLCGIDCRGMSETVLSDHRSPEWKTQQIRRIHRDAERTQLGRELLFYIACHSRTVLARFR